MQSQGTFAHPFWPGDQVGMSQPVLGNMLSQHMHCPFVAKHIPIHTLDFSLEKPFWGKRSVESEKSGNVDREKP
jgi:hypothetical protein